MYVHIQGPISRRQYFWTLAIGVAVLTYATLNSQTNDEFALYLGALLFVLYVIAVSVFLLFAPRTTDSVFGRAICPHCRRRTWSLRDILRISPWTTVRCSHCSYAAKMRVWWLAMGLFGIPVWLAALIGLDSFAWAFLLLATYSMLCLYLTIRLPSIR